MKKTTQILSIVFNLFVFLSAAVSVLLMFLVSGSGNMLVSRFRIFLYFTVDSNILCAIACLLIAIARIRAIKGQNAFLSKKLLALKYAGTVAVTVTMLTVILFLVQFYGFKALYQGANLYLHLLSPLAALCSFILIDIDFALSSRYITLSVFPTLIYGIIYLIMVVFIGEENGGWKDFYGFNIGGHWYISMVIMLCGTAFSGFIILKLHNSMAARKDLSLRNDL